MRRKSPAKCWTLVSDPRLDVRLAPTVLQPLRVIVDSQRQLGEAR